MKRMMITESVRNLLLDSDFLESVLGSPIVEPDANSWEAGIFSKV